MLGRIPEPHELADAYYAAQEERYRSACEGMTCSDCAKYFEAPGEWCSVPHGWCNDCMEHVRGCDSVLEYDCGSFEER